MGCVAAGAGVAAATTTATAATTTRVDTDAVAQIEASISDAVIGMKLQPQGVGLWRNRRRKWVATVATQQRRAGTTSIAHLTQTNQ